MNRSVVVAVATGLLVGSGVAAAVVSASEAPGAAAGSASDLQVVSRWSGRSWQGGPITKLVSGSLRADPARGFALLEMKGLKPAFFSTPEGEGALRLSSVSHSVWQLRSSRGAVVIVDPGDPTSRAAPSFTYLGRRLNPDKLGPIASRGVAVAYGDGPWTNGRQAETDVVLVTPSKRRPGWTVYGYLKGFTLPRVATEQKVQEPLLDTEQELKQPLLGPNGRLYSIDTKKERLVPARGWRSVARRFTFGACTTWPAQDGGSYHACQSIIRLHTAHGATVTVLHRHLPKLSGRSWLLVQPSPNGKWLLLQDAFGACGLVTWAYILPSRGGPLRSAFPGAYTSEALGWLPDNTALVAAQSEGCDANPTAGIYQVTPGDPSFQPPPQLVFAGYVFDATSWGFGDKPAR